jgi:hypothetical protein
MMRRTFAFWMWIAFVIPSHAQDVQISCNGYLLYNVHNARADKTGQTVAGVEIDHCDLNRLSDKVIDQIIQICGEPGSITTKEITNPKTKCKIMARYDEKPYSMYHVTKVIQVCGRGRCYRFPRQR